MSKPWKFLLSLVLTAFFAVLFMPYCFLGCLEQGLSG